MALRCIHRKWLPPIFVVCALVLAAAPASAAGKAAAARPTAGPSARVCPPEGLQTARCHSLVRVDKTGTAITNPTPVGYGPAQFNGAYSLPGTASGATPTIAIVDAYDDPNISSDLNTYILKMGISNPGTFTKVNQTGGTRYPRANQSWALEISLDVEIARAICNNCNILLVEASSNSFTNLMAAVDYAASHANVVSMSWGSSEFSSEASYDGHFTKSGIAFTASSGDTGNQVEYPSASPNVVAVGGTTLNVNGSGPYSYGTESAWNSGGSGCSAYEKADGWQSTMSGWPCGSDRGTVDVAADADPNTGAAVYDSYGYFGQNGWFQVGGTSLASPLIASVYAIAGNFGASAAQYTYSHASQLHDITSGSNGSCGTIMCNATSGYDGPTGLGTPNGTGAF
jgi:subtilase family serine protease